MFNYACQQQKFEYIALGLDSIKAKVSSTAIANTQLPRDINKIIDEIVEVLAGRNTNSQSVFLELIRYVDLQMIQLVGRDEEDIEKVRFDKNANFLKVSNLLHGILNIAFELIAILKAKLEKKNLLQRFIENQLPDIFVNYLYGKNAPHLEKLSQLNGLLEYLRDQLPAVQPIPGMSFKKKAHKKLGKFNFSRVRNYFKKFNGLFVESKKDYLYKKLVDDVENLKNSISGVAKELKYNKTPLFQAFDYESVKKIAEVLNEATPDEDIRPATDLVRDLKANNISFFNPNRFPSAQLILQKDAFRSEVITKLAERRVRKENSEYKALELADLQEEFKDLKNKYRRLSDYKNKYDNLQSLYDEYMPKIHSYFQKGEIKKGKNEWKYNLGFLKHSNKAVLAIAKKLFENEKKSNVYQKDVLSKIEPKLHEKILSLFKVKCIDFYNVIFNIQENEKNQNGKFLQKTFQRYTVKSNISLRLQKAALAHTLLLRLKVSTRKNSYNEWNIKESNLLFYFLEMTSSLGKTKLCEYPHYIILNKDGINPNNKEQGIYLYRTGEPKQVFALIVHSKISSETLNLSKLCRDSKQEHLINNLNWSNGGENYALATTQLSQELLYLIISNCNYIQPNLQYSNEIDYLKEMNAKYFNAFNDYLKAFISEDLNNINTENLEGEYKSKVKQLQQEYKNIKTKYEQWVRDTHESFNNKYLKTETILMNGILHVAIKDGGDTNKLLRDNPFSLYSVNVVLKEFEDLIKIDLKNFEEYPIDLIYKYNKLIEVIADAKESLNDLSVITQDYDVDKVKTKWKEQLDNIKVTICGELLKEMQHYVLAFGENYPLSLLIKFLSISDDMYNINKGGKNKGFGYKLFKVGKKKQATANEIEFDNIRLSFFKEIVRKFLNNISELGENAKGAENPINLTHQIKANLQYIIDKVSSSRILQIRFSKELQALLDIKAYLDIPTSKEVAQLNTSELAKIKNAFDILEQIAEFEGAKSSLTFFKCYLFYDIKSTTDPAFKGLKEVCASLAEEWKSNKRKEIEVIKKQYVAIIKNQEELPKQEKIDSAIVVLRSISEEPEHIKLIVDTLLEYVESDTFNGETYQYLPLIRGIGNISILQKFYQKRLQYLYDAKNFTALLAEFEAVAQEELVKDELKKIILEFTYHYLENFTGESDDYLPILHKLYHFYHKDDEQSIAKYRSLLSIYLNKRFEFLINTNHPNYKPISFLSIDELKNLISVIKTLRTEQYNFFEVEIFERLVEKIANEPIEYWSKQKQILLKYLNNDVYRKYNFKLFESLFSHKLESEIIEKLLSELEASEDASEKLFTPIFENLNKQYYSHNIDDFLSLFTKSLCSLKASSKYSLAIKLKLLELMRKYLSNLYSNIDVKKNKNIARLSSEIDLLQKELEVEAKLDTYLISLNENEFIEMLDENFRVLLENVNLARDSQVSRIKALVQALDFYNDHHKGYSEEAQNKLAEFFNKLILKVANFYDQEKQSSYFVKFSKSIWPDIRAVLLENAEIFNALKLDAKHFSFSLIGCWLRMLDTSAVEEKESSEKRTLTYLNAMPERFLNFIFHHAFKDATIKKVLNIIKNEKRLLCALPEKVSRLALQANIPYCHYKKGRKYELLGNKEIAIKHYQIASKDLVEAKERLVKLVLYQTSKSSESANVVAEAKIQTSATHQSKQFYKTRFANVKESLLKKSSFFSRGKSVPKLTFSTNKAYPHKNL